MLKIIRFLFGYITFTITGSFPERFINLISRRGISLWNIQKNSKTCTACAFYSEYKSLVYLSKKSSMEISITQKKGLPFILKKYKKRLGIPIGMACFFLIIQFLSLYMWNIDISGNESIEKDEIYSLLSELSIEPGTNKNKIDTNHLESLIINRFNNISWASANIVGSNLEIEIKEKTAPPKVEQDNSPCNIKAKSDGYITRMEIYSGTPEIKCGDAVTKDQLLVSGTEEVIENDSFIHAEAKIFAITTKSLTECVELTNYRDIETGKNIKRKRLNIFNLSVPLSLWSIPKGNYKRSTEIKKLDIKERSLPISIYSECWTEYKKEKFNYSKDEAKKLATEVLNNREKIEMSELKILKKNISENIIDNNYYLTATYTCEENIAINDPIFS